MKQSLLLALLLPLHTVAQIRPGYTPPRPAPTYSPPLRTFAPTPYQTQLQSQQQAHQNFQRMQAQQTQQAMQYFNQQNTLRLQNSLRQQQMQQQFMLRRPLTAQQLEQQQAHQQEAEQQATDYLARFAEDQRAMRLAHPAADAQQAEAQQQEDARQLTAVAVKTYREVFLPGQLHAAMQARILSPKAQADFQTIHQDLLSNAWWSKLDATQLHEKLAAYSQTLAAHTTDLLGFDIASPAPAPVPLSTSALDAQLAANAFDQATATQLLRDAAMAEKRLEGGPLAQAVRTFRAQAAAAPLAAADPKQRQKDLQKSLRNIDRELQRYYASISDSPHLYLAQKAILASTDTYLEKNKK